MKFQQVKRLLQKAKVLTLAFASAAALTACSFEFSDLEGKTAQASEYIQQTGSLAKEKTDQFASSVSDKIENTDWDKIKQDTKEAADAAKELSDKISGEAQKLATETNLGQFEKATLVRVVDGDTIIVNIGQEDVKVRLIGIDTPESVASQEYLDKTGKENTQEGKDASDYTKLLLQNTDYVYLQKDDGDTDKYGRSLRYVWLETPSNEGDIEEIKAKMLQGMLLDAKVAIPLTIEPNTMYAEQFEEIYEMD